MTPTARNVRRRDPDEGGIRSINRWLVRAFVTLTLLVLVAALAGSGYQSKLSSVQKNDNSAYLPSSAEATQVANISTSFNADDTIPGFLVYHRAGGLTGADRAKIMRDEQALRSLPGLASGRIGDPVVARDGATAALSVPLVARVDGKDVQGNDLSDAEKRIQDLGHRGNPPGLEVHTAGAGGLLGAFIDAFSGLDGKLLITAGLVVIVLLLLVYRSPVLWAVPLVSVALALSLSSGIVYALAKSGKITLNGQSQGILSVLVFGAGTDYALLLISRYREQLHHQARRRDAMVAALRGAAAPIAASAATVIASMLCLLASDLNSNRSLGPVLAIGVACTVLVMLTLLPTLLVLLGRWIFWPRIPRAGQTFDTAHDSGWARLAGFLGRHARPAWAAGLVILVVGIVFLPGLKASGLSSSDVSPTPRMR